MATRFYLGHLGPLRGSKVPEGRNHVLKMGTNLGHNIRVIVGGGPSKARQQDVTRGFERFGMIGAVVAGGP